jgi:hypothetical protein
MRPTRDDEDRLVDLFEDEVEEDGQDEGPLYPMRLVQGEDDIVTDTSRDRGGWSAEELAMHLVEEP